MKPLKPILAVLFSFSFFIAKSSHFFTAEISYQFVSTNTYKVRVDVISQCNSNFAQIIGTAYSASNSFLQFTLYRVDSSEILNYCPTTLSNCQSATSTNFGFRHNICEGIVTLPSAASDWTFKYSDGARSSIIINGFGGQNISVYSTLDNINNVINSSPQFGSDGLLFFNVNQTYHISSNTTDMDGDSLSFHLDTPRSSQIYTSLSFSNPYTASHPIPSTLFNLDSVTGELDLTPTAVGNYVFCERIEEYRGGVLIGKTYRDFFITIGNSGVNNLPTLSGINNSNNYSIIANVCGPLSFTINSADADVADSTFLICNNTIPNASFTSNSSQNATGTFSWTPTVADVRPQPYLLHVKVRDNKCPNLGQQSYTYLIYLNQCNTDTVWSGDANADFVVNNFDALNIGIANGSTGAVRAGATTNWQPEYCTNWLQGFVNGNNYKHADCNGDGIINATDYAAVTANYGSFHTKKKMFGKYKTRGLPDLYFDKTNIHAVPGTTINIPIQLGTATSSMNNIYGIAATIDVTNIAPSSPIALTNATSWLGNSSNTYLFQKNINNTELPFSLVRTNQTNTSGSGTLATLSISIPSNATVGTYIDLKFADIKLIGNDGAEITDYNVKNDSLLIQFPESVQDVTTSNFSVHPVPTNNLLYIQAKKAVDKNYKICLVNSIGELMMNTTFSKLPTANNQYALNISKLPSGLYYLQIESNGKWECMKLVKE